VTVLLVALGAAVGAPLRYVFAHLLDGDQLPSGTIAVNWVGSFLLGWFSALGLSEQLMALLGTGFCGALTTYSAFAVQTRRRGPRLGTANVLVTLAPALFLCASGFALGSIA
jgi:CrcB protein